MLSETARRGIELARWNRQVQVARAAPPPTRSLRAPDPRVALEDQGQQILLRYLAGDQVPQTRADFARCAELYSEAQKLTPESVLLEARKAFCQGRAALFDKDYAGGATLLERAARLDPSSA